MLIFISIIYLLSKILTNIKRFFVCGGGGGRTYVQKMIPLLFTYSLLMKI